MWINRLERKFGKYAIKDLPIIMAFTYLVGYLLSTFNNLYPYFMFNPYLIIHKFEVWRLFTWIFCTGESSSNILFLAITVFFYYSIARVLTEAWGAFRFNLYIFSGLILTVLGAFLLYGGLVLYYNLTRDGSIFYFLQDSETVEYFNALSAEYGMIDNSVMCELIGYSISSCVSTYFVFMSTLLAFAATYPDMQILLYFIIPLKMKWLGVLYAAFIVYFIIVGTWLERCIIVISVLNFIIFFISIRKSRKLSPAEKLRQAQYRTKIKKAQKEMERRYENGAKHKCCICGRTDADNPELTFRYCSKCTGGKEYCNEHLFTHTHN